MAILAHLYPTVRPRPSLSSNAIADMLPLVHKYDIACLLEDCLAYLNTALPDQLSPQISSPDYVIKWLKLVCDLQLDGLKAMCMKKAREMARKSQLGGAIMSSDQLKAMPTKPETCCMGHRNSQNPLCPSWCHNCNDWVCTYQWSGIDQGGLCLCKPPSNTPGCCQTISPSSGSAPTISGPLKVNDIVKSLSRDALEELLASVVAACNCEYSA